MVASGCIYPGTSGHGVTFCAPTDLARPRRISASGHLQTPGITPPGYSGGRFTPDNRRAVHSTASVMPSRSATGEVATLAAALFAIAKVIVGILVWKTLALLKRGTLLTPACPSSKLAGT